jgi:SagB-type dehydrogenase family enzyme
MLTKFSRKKNAGSPGETIPLPQPAHDSNTSVEQALQSRRSIRQYQAAALTLGEISALLWAAQGITHPQGYRTAPSAGALYPVETYLIAGKVEALPAGVYKYIPDGHMLVKTVEGDVRKRLSHAALNQEPVREGAASILMAAVYERTSGKYGERAPRYVHMEVGCAAQNVYLQAVSLDLGTVFIGAFYDAEVKTIAQLEKNEQPLCLMPVGKNPYPY